jgi:DNA-binding MarR family transcriptional regulator
MPTPPSDLLAMHDDASCASHRAKALNTFHHLKRLGAFLDYMTDLYDYLGELPDVLPEELAAIGNNVGLIILLNLHEKQEGSVMRISEEIGVDKSNVSRIIKSMESAGLLNVRGEPQDRRLRVFSLAPRGAVITTLLLDQLARSFENQTKIIRSLTKIPVPQLLDPAT